MSTVTLPSPAPVNPAPGRVPTGPASRRPAPTVPDQVPPLLASQHPDAAAVVTAAVVAAARPGTVGRAGAVGVRRLVRDARRPWPARVSALTACLLVAALSAGPAGRPDPAPAAPPALVATAPGATCVDVGPALWRNPLTGLAASVPCAAPGHRSTSVGNEAR